MRTKSIKRNPKPKVYPTREAATQRYIKNAKVSQSSGDILMRRQLQKIEIAREETSDPTNVGGAVASLGKQLMGHDVTASAGTPSISLSSTSSVDSGYVFRHDPALLISGLNHSEDDIKSFLSDIQCPVLYIVSTNPDRRTVQYAITLSFDLLLHSRVHHHFVSCIHWLKSLPYIKQKFQKDLEKKGGDLDLILNPMEVSVFDIARVSSHICVDVVSSPQIHRRGFANIITILMMNRCV
jgi:hypothetical protein